MAMLPHHPCVTTPSRSALKQGKNPLFSAPQEDSPTAQLAFHKSQSSLGLGHEKKLSTLLRLQYRNKGWEGLLTGERSARVSEHRYNKFSCKPRAVIKTVLILKEYVRKS